MKNLATKFAASLALAAALCSASVSAKTLLKEPPPEIAAPVYFQPGESVIGFGMFARIDSDLPVPADTKFAVSFDTAKSAEGKVNRTLDAAARFINMHADAGVPEENMRLAIVVHGGAVFDMASNEAYARKYEGVKENPNAAIIAALREKGVDVIICGQSAAYHRVAKQELLPGVKMALSAMTAHALLQQDGYTLNPF